MSVEGLRRDSVWWGWGRTDDRPSLGEAAREMLSAELGRIEGAPRVDLEEVRLPEPRPLPASVVQASGGEGGISTDPEDRLRHAAGKSYPDLVRMRTGTPTDAPDAILAPRDGYAVAGVLAACAREQVAVVPFGGGTSVVGGVEPLRGRFDRLASLDLGAMRAVSVDERAQTATLGPGLRGPEAEAELNRRGLTLGHFPQSFPYATIGGFAATRSAGQASTGYGRFDELVTSVTMQTPEGPISTLETPHTAAGPALRELIVGSEGTLGVITDVTVRVKPLPESRRYEGWFAESFEQGIEIARALAQSGVAPDVFRLSDRDETRVSLAMSGLEGLKRSALEAYLSLRGRREGCMMILGWEGDPESVARRRELTAAGLRSGGAVPLGTTPGKAWEHGRYEGPYMRDVLMDAGVMVETLETSHTYSRIDELYTAVRAALHSAMADRGAEGIVMCHVSHIYRDGA
ncbi:MAG TPA: FAD-binding oxidoreductase, partial [Solirubrobacterales bacterium]|nr:FAD-binding oxidoreductase [Solirubrobacterales bacterium]